ncbi:MAG: hypothetical protein GX969_05370 [Firmicutes bacterium]|nr:hypothetical protein [Bacillota bacterium]
MYGEDFNGEEELENYTPTEFSLKQVSKLKATRDVEVIRSLEYNPTGYSIGANVGGLVADEFRVNAALS